MPRSNRRCAISLHDVAKWTVPSCVSAFSRAGAGCASDIDAAAIMASGTANAVLIIVSSRLAVATNALAVTSYATLRARRVRARPRESREPQLMEQLDYHLLYRQFVRRTATGCSMHA